jgi:hypothetical protein
MNITIQRFHHWERRVSARPADALQEKHGT